MRKPVKILAGFLGAAAIGIVTDLAIDTGPLVCAVDPTCRKLTQDEIEQAKPIFGNQLQYDHVHIFERLMIYTPYLNWLFDSKAIAQSAKNSIYMPDNDDVTRTHELTHVWQKQNNVPRILEQNIDRRYDLSQKPSFYKMGREQQAEIVEFYFTLSQHLNKPASGDMKAGLCTLMGQHEAILQPVLPIAPHKACAAP